jgi:hypothetical protein
MYCPHCVSGTQAEVTAEINIQFSGATNIDRPGIFVFPNLLVCLECGFSRFTMPETELAMLAMCSPRNDASSQAQAVRDVALGRTTAA